MKSWAMIGVLALAGLAYGEGVTVKPIATQPATAPATQKAEAPVNLESIIAQMPEELRPAKGEMSTRRDAREKWLKENVAPTVRERKEKKFREVYAQGVVGAVHYDEKADTLYVSVALKHQPNIGNTIQVLAELPGDMRKETLSWRAGDSITVSGRLVSFDESGGKITDAKVTSHEAKTDAPRLDPVKAKPTGKKEGGGK